jgi:RNA polymerase sigma-70 factor (ECF subfamily)
MVPTDVECLAMVRRGDPAGAEALFQRHAGGILRFAGRMMGSQHDAEEICQEVFLKMIDRADQYDGHAPFPSWLMSIAANACRDQHRRRRRRQTLPLTDAAEVAAPGPTAQALLLERERRAAVEAALSALSEEQREALVLARYHGLPYVEIAATLGISVGAVKTRIFRAMETLKDLFARPEEAAGEAGDAAEGAPAGDARKEDSQWTAAKP